MSIPTRNQLVQDICQALKEMTSKSKPGWTPRGAHARTIAVVNATLTVRPDIEHHHAVGVFSKPGHQHPCMIRFSSSSPIVQPDHIPDLRGCAIKLFATEEDRKIGKARKQDFVLISARTMPLSARDFRDLIVLANHHNKLYAALRILIGGYLPKLLTMRGFRMVPNSIISIPYHSTTPYKFGPDHQVKYAVFPTTTHHRPPVRNLADPKYLTHELQNHLREADATYDFCVQFRKGNQPIENCGIIWDESISPFVRLAELRISKQEFAGPTNEELGEALSLSPGHALHDHEPLSELDYVREAVYAEMSKFRHERDHRKPI